MTIYHPKANERLSNIERCAELAPAGTYERAKAAKAVIDEVADSIFTICKAHGFKLRGMDGYRDIEAQLYVLLADSNPDEYGLITGEGFGAAMDGPARERVLAQTVRDRDALTRILGEA
jgi:hypothetical protein